MKQKRKRWAVGLLILVMGLLTLSGCSRTGSGLFWRFLTVSEEYQEQMRRLADGAVSFIHDVYEKQALQRQQEKSDDPYLLLLIGSDRRQDNWYGNSDVMLLLSVNRSAQTISLTSFMRDLGVTIPGVGYGKLNWAYAKGGPDLLVQTIEQNFALSVDNYAAVDFDSMAQVIDLMGGVTLDISAEEAEVTNRYISSADYKLQTTGVQRVNGIQAVAYCRNRSTGGSDYSRTARQRLVMEQLVQNVKQMNAARQLEMAMQLMAVISHDISADQLPELLGLAVLCKDYSVVTDRIPYDGLYTSHNENLDPVWDETIARLHEALGL